jgi:hypothetical protein
MKKSLLDKDYQYMHYHHFRIVLNSISMSDSLMLISLCNLVKHVQGCQNQCLVRLYDLPVHYHLVQNVVSFLNIVHYIQLANILKVFVHRLN